MGNRIGFDADAVLEFRAARSLQTVFNWLNRQSKKCGMSARTRTETQPRD